MSAVVRCGILAAFLPTVEVPPLSGPATTYHFSGPLLYPVSGYTTTSKYVLYDNGAFSPQFVRPPGELTGIYAQEAGQISFRFVHPHSPEDTASGTFNGVLLEVRYNDRMLGADYENAIYRRSQ